MSGGNYGRTSEYVDTTTLDVVVATTTAQAVLTRNNTQFSPPTFKKLTLSEMNTNDVEPEDQIYVDLPPKKDDLAALIRKSMTDNEKTDVKVKVGNVCFSCYLSVLQTYSDLLKELSLHGDIELLTDKVTPIAFAKIYDWMLKGEAIVPGENIIEFISAAYYLCIGDLIADFWQWIDDANPSKEDMIVMLYIKANKTKLDEVQKPLLQRIGKYFLTLVASRDFLMLEVGDVSALLASSAIGVNTEVEILMAAVHWLNQDWESRKEHILEVAQCVPFRLFTTWFLALLVLNVDGPEVRRVIDNQDVKGLIADGTRNKSLESVNELGQHNMELTKKRLFVYDRCCSYHRHTQRGTNVFITYKMFTDYLNFIRSTDKMHWSTLEVLQDDGDLTV